jgi:putative ribosome biogenesis GTPase RsgA
MNYDPNSTDSMLSRILERMDAQDAKLESIHVQVVLTNGRVKMLEVWRDELKGKVTILAGILSVGISALTHWLFKRS